MVELLAAAGLALLGQGESLRNNQQDNTYRKAKVFNSIVHDENCELVGYLQEFICLLDQHFPKFQQRDKNAVIS